MTTAVDLTISAPAFSPDPLGGGRHIRRTIWQFCRRKPLGAVGGVIVVLMLFIALFVDTAIIGGNTPVLAPDGYNEQHIRRADRDQGVTLQHPMGTDELGRDVAEPGSLPDGARLS